MAPLTCHKTILALDCAAVHRVLEPYAAVARVVVDGGKLRGASLMSRWLDRLPLMVTAFQMNPRHVSHCRTWQDSILLPGILLGQRNSLLLILLHALLAV